MNTHDVPVRLQQMPPECARFCLQAERFCRDALHLDISRQKILAAYSGGADSLAVVLTLYALAARTGLSLGLVTVDHGLRHESAHEADAAARLAECLGVPFFTQCVDVRAMAAASGMGLEEAGREARYAVYERIRAAEGYSWVALGHQLNDLAEDSLMRLIRGAGWPALAGMKGIDPRRRVFRPLLLCTRARIEKFLTLLGRSWVSDPMNLDPHYFRNRVRQQLMPLLLAENPAFLEQTAIRWRLARLDAELFEGLVPAVSLASLDPGAPCTVTLSPDMLAPLATALRLRVYKQLLDALGAGQVSAPALLALDAAWQRGEGGKCVRFPGGKSAVIRKSGIVFSLNG